MDATYVYVLIRNNRAASRDAYQRCERALRAAEALPGMASAPGDQCGLGIATGLGDVIKAMLWEYAGREHGLTETGSTGLTAMLFSGTIDHISSEHLGDLFYTSTREEFLG